MLKVEARCFVCAAGESGVCLVHAVRCLARPGRTCSDKKIFELQAMTAGYLEARYFRVLSLPEGRSDGDPTGSAIPESCGISLYEMVKNSIQVDPVHAHIRNKIEHLLVRFLIDHAQFPSGARVPPRQVSRVQGSTKPPLSRSLPAFT